MPHKILYVEDEIAIIQLIRDVLNHPEIRLLSATTGSSGIKQIREVRPDLVLLDVLMPDRNGWTIYEELRRDDELCETPIIMLTGILHRYHVMKQFADSHIDAYITKPFNAGAIRYEVQKMLDVVLWPNLVQETRKLPVKTIVNHHEDIVPGTGVPDRLEST